MAQCPGENLNDSDETFYCPDTDKDPSEARFLDSLGENDEDFFEREYNKYSPMGLGQRPTYHEPDSDQTFFELAENALLRSNLGNEQLPDTEETYYEPAEFANRLQHQEAHERSPGATAPPTTPPSAALVTERHGRGRDGARDEDVLIQDHLEPHGSFAFTHNWSPACSQVVQGDVGGNPGHECGEGAPSLPGPGPASAALAVAPFELYVQMADPLTQEMRLYHLPGFQGGPHLGPDTMRLLTQDFYWTQTQAQVLPGEVGHGPNLCDHQVLPDPSHTQQAREGLQRGLYQDQHAGQPSEASRLLTQDLDWNHAQSDGVAMDMIEVPKHELAPCLPHTASSGNSMDFGSASPRGQSGQGGQGGQGLGQGASAATGRPHAPHGQQLVGSSYSSESQKLPSVPSFDDDLPPTPHLRLSTEEQFKMEQIVTSLRCMSFHLDDDVQGLAGSQCARPDQGPATKTCPSNSLPRPSAPSSSPLERASPPASAPRSPTFVTTRCRRRRGRRPGSSASSRLDDSRSTPGVAQDKKDLTEPTAGGFKRKRSGVAPLTRSGSFGPVSQQQRTSQTVFSCSPSSPPRRKARRTFGPAPSASPRDSRVGRVEMIAVYARLRELRYLMQDIIGGREPLPTPTEVGKMQQEVQSIIGNIGEAEPSNSRRLTKAIIKRQEARQVADKILHQLQVIEASYESQLNEGVLSDGATYTSWSNPTIEIPLQSLPIDSNAESKFCPPEEKRATATRGKENTKSASKEKQQKSCKQKKGPKKTKAHLTQESQENTAGMNNDSTANIWQSCIISSNSVKTDTDRKFGITFVEETEEIYQETATDTLIEIPQTEIHEDTNYSVADFNKETKVPSVADNSRDQATQTISYNERVESHTVEKDPAKQEEYELIVGLIKSKAATTLKTTTFGNNIAQENNFDFDPMKLTGILLPKQSELEPILDFPDNFWGNPKARIPDEWVSMLEWDT